MTADRSIPSTTLGKRSSHVARLRDVMQHKVAGLTVIDGVKLTLDLLDRGVDVLELYATPDRSDELSAHPSVAALARRGSLFLLAPALLERLAPTRSSQGVLAIVRIPSRTLGTDGIVVYLDRVQDPGNVGAVIRNAAAFGAGGVACSPGCGDPFSAKAVRGSAGASLLLPVASAAEFGPLAEAVTARGGEVAAAVGVGGVAPRRWRPRLPLLLVLGNEGGGVADEIVRRCSVRVTVPLAAGVESLNVAAASAVLLAGLAGVVASPILDLESSVRREP